MRQRAEGNTKEAEDIRASGIKSKTAPLHVIESIVKDTILKASNGFIWDDRMYQSGYFYDLFKKNNWDVKVVFLDANRDTQILRSNKRLFCATECKEPDPKKSGCNSCSGDEIEQEFLNRITKEKEDIKVVLEFWKDKPNFCYIDTSDKKVEDVFSEIVHCIEGTDWLG